RIAHLTSKSVLRAVCGAAALDRPMVDYFPSYEAATLSAAKRVWEPDRIHVTGGFVGKIVAHMLAGYLEGGEAAPLTLQSARTHLYARRYEEAEADARSVLQLRPADVEAGAILAESL